jgi:putative acetyltransferase
VTSTIRPEALEDRPRIRTVTSRAFGQPDEAALIDALRQEARPFISLVATEHDELVGHISFSPVTIGADSSLDCLGLAPMAVAPEWQRRGIGWQLVRAGLDACRQHGIGVVVVLGHPEYYPRFGFAAARQKGLACEFAVPDEAFMVLELTHDALRDRSGLVRYHPVFSRF